MIGHVVLEAQAFLAQKVPESCMSRPILYVLLRPFRSCMSEFLYVQTPYAAKQNKSLLCVKTVAVLPVKTVVTRQNSESKRWVSEIPSTSQEFSHRLHRMDFPLLA